MSAADVQVLVVDDSVVVRQLVVRALADEKDLRVAVAANGLVAMSRIPQLAPDVVILDLEMPEMDGFETLAEIRRFDRRLPVIVFSHLTASGAAATLEALARGATAFVLKPTADHFGLAQDYIRAELLPLVRALTRPQASAGPSPLGADHVGSVATRKVLAPPVTAIVIAVSTGGPTALTTVIGRLPADLRVPVLIVQHMPATFTKMLAERLDRVSALSVVEAAGGDTVLPGHVYVAPGGHHMGVDRSLHRVTIVIHDGPPEHSCRPAADVLFRSAVEALGAGVLGVVLTGMGTDGLLGAKAICAAGGAVIAQSAETAVVAGMPAAVADAGFATAVVPLDGIAATLARWSTVGRWT